jgi:hypothetical protein
LWKVPTTPRFQDRPKASNCSRVNRADDMLAAAMADHGSELIKPDFV